MISRFREEYDWLSNFYSVPIFYKGTLYQSSEAAYMSQRNHSEEWKKFCADPFSKANLIKRQSKLIEDRPDWPQVKLQVMEEVLRIKFSVPYLREKLIATGNQNIQEGNDWKDQFWGIRFDMQPNYGENHLGRLIMKIRDELLINTV